MKTKNSLFISGSKVKRMTSYMKKKMKRRNAIEPIIGHMKSDGRLGRNYLKGKEGDQMNCILAAIGHNFRKIRKYIRSFLYQIYIFCSIQQQKKILNIFSYKAI